MAVAVSNVITQARNNLLDTTAVSGQLLTDNQYLGLVNEAILEVNQYLRVDQFYRIVRDRAVRVTKNYAYLELDNIDLPDFGYATDCWWQRLENFLVLTGGAGSGTLTLTWATPVTLSVGQPVVIGGFTNPRVGGEFPVLTINGTPATSISVGAQTVDSFTAPPGWIMWGTTGWGYRLQPVSVLPGLPMTPGAGDDRITFMERGVRFTPASFDRMLRIRYVVGGNPTVGLTDILDCQEGMTVLGQMLALAAGSALGAHPSRLDELKQKIYGDGTRHRPGSLNLLRQSVALQRQNQQYVRPRWKARHAPTYPVVIQS